MNCGASKASVVRLTPHFWPFVYALSADPCASRAIECARATTAYSLVTDALEQGVDWFLLDKDDIAPGIVVDADQLAAWPDAWAFHDITYLFLRLIAAYPVMHPTRPYLERAYRRMVDVCEIGDITDGIERFALAAAQ